MTGWPVVRFTRAELESFRGAEVPDLLGPATRLLFVGINPGLRTAATQTHFGNPVNRFYPALLRAGIIEEPVDVTDPMTDEVKAALRRRGGSASPTWYAARPRAPTSSPPPSCARAPSGWSRWSSGCGRAWSRCSA